MNVLPSEPMPSNKPLLHIVMDPEFIERIDDYYHRRRFPSRSAAVIALLEWALEQDPELQPQRRRAPRERRGTIRDGDG
jgi:Arc/MetJ-type ribon-helix-helix transcriptional regulator